MYDHQGYEASQEMEAELHENHVAESKARQMVCYASSFMWVALGLSALIASLSFATQQ